MVLNKPSLSSLATKQLKKLCSLIIHLLMLLSMVSVCRGAANSYTMSNFISTTSTMADTGDGGKATSARMYRPNGCWMTTSGILYVADADKNRIRRVDTSNIINSYAGSSSSATSTGDGGPASSATFNSAFHVWGNSLGVLYVSEQNGNKIRSIDLTSTIVSTFAGNGTVGSYGNGGPATAAIIGTVWGVYGDTMANLYVADSGYHRVRRVDYLTRIITLVCGTGTSTYNGDNLAATSTNIYFPSNVLITTTAVLYFSEVYGNRVRLLSGSTGLVSAFAGTGSGISGSSGGAATSTTIYNPQGVVMDTEGSVYFPTVQGHRLHQVTTNNIFYHVAGSGSTGVGTGTALSAAIGYPKAAWITSTGTIYCPADGSVRMLTNINPTTIPTAAPTVAPSVSQSPTTALPTLNPTFTFTPGPFFMTLEGGTGTGGSGADGIPATSSALRQPYQVCHSSVTAIQGLLVADYYNLLVKKIDDNGIVTRFAGGGISTSAGLPATSFYLYNPVSVMADTSGNVLIGSDQGNYIHKVSSSGSIVSRYAGTGISVTSSTDLNGDHGPATSASLCLPYFIHTDTVSQTYFADFCALRVRKITTSGIISSIAGTGAYDTSLTTGPATSSALYYPYGVYCDTNGKVYISEYNGQRLKVVASGIHYWIAGTGNAGFNLESGSATSVQFSHPTGVFGDSSGNIFLSDANARVRVLLTDGILSTIMGTGVTAASLIYSGMATSVPIKPHGIYVDSAGFIHVSDVYDGTGGNLIRKVYSVAPTAAPSVSFSPSVTPTIAPSTLPSIVPTICPSVLPTVSPTDGPSIVPSNAPTAVPTLKPTIAPTVAPTVPPTVTPTLFPTVMPTVEPSLIPTVAPTTVPTMLPTVLPTLDPTVTPTLAPTCRPTALPSVHPSMLPSDSPTVSPSCAPSLAPSDSPSVVPSELPTASPSECPSIFPSEMPSRTPTEQPTVSPSVSPSKKPSTAPTFGPTVTPTVEPSVGPTLCPSIVPSLAPSIFPTELPSTIPTHIPSVLPSQGPSVLPSIGPSFPPTNEPSLWPSVLPTVVPSKTPSEPPSQEPTLAPSLDPSARPSTLPSLVPTSLPTVKPSVDPSLLPTTVPTTICPTIAPSTLEFYLTHPRATLPSNRSISVVGYYSGVKFKIVLPFLSVSKVMTADAFSDVTLITGATGEAKLVSGGELLASTIDVRTQPLSYVKSITFDYSQRSVSVIPDFNGDGYDDLIIGDPFASRCYVLYGNEQGLTNMTTGFTIFGQDVDLTGWSVSGAGDFNNDTMQDIVIGAPNAEGVGAVYVIYGKRTMMDVYLNNLTSSVGFSFFGAISNDFVGISVSSAGDVNKDGCDDIVIGSVGTAAYFAGAAFIIYGGKSLQSTTSSSLTLIQGYKLSGVSYQYAGYSVSAAEDVNNDGYDDVVIGSCPQRSSLTLSSYIIFGAPSTSVTTNVQLASLTASQGVRITGAGVIVSGAGDVNNDTFSDVLVTSLDVTGDQKMGWIVYSNIDRLLVQTSVYTANPTRLPSHAPSRWPSVRPTLRPSRVPTVQPVIVPSVAPTGPTFQPNSLTGAPTKLPTDLPTVVPSMEPSESPTAVPSVEPSEKPSCEPSRLPTAHPSVQPSEVPSVIPTVQTSSTHPSLGAATRPPFSVPTFLPTVADTFPDIVDFQVRGGSDVLDHSDSWVNYRYVVNATGQVDIVSSRGANTYYIVPQTNLTLAIWTFNQSTDVIDLTLYKSFYRMSDLSISSGSINIRLSATELIHILNLEPKDITNSNFVFAAEEPDNQFMHFVVTVISVSVSLGGLLIILFFAYRFYQWRAKKALDLAGVWATRLMMTYASTADGEYLFKADIPQKDVDSALPDWINESDGSKDDELLSQHTLDSEGDWMFKSLKANNCTSVHNPEVDSVDSRLMSEFSFNSDGDFVDKV